MSDAFTTGTDKPARHPRRRLQRILFAGGGTGGHVYMAVAIRDYLMSGAASPTCLFVGTEEGLENRILPPLDFPLATIRIGGLQRVGWKRQLSSLSQLPGSLLKSLMIVRRFNPQVAVGLGGYSSGPVIAAARVWGVPSALIEPNVIPGLANRCLSRFCQGAAVAFPETTKWFRGRVRVTGIPIRRQFHEIPALASHTGPLRLLVFGGSRGSRPINRLLVEAMARIDPSLFSLVHQTGPDDYPLVLGAYRKAGIEADVREFIHDMPHQFEVADLIVSRAGASTIAEVTAAGRPAILIPFPHAADDHQRRNAEALAQRGAAILLDQTVARPEDLAATLAKLAAEPERLQAMGKAAHSLARPDSTAQIASLLEAVAGGAP